MTAPIDYNKLGAVIGAAIAAALGDGRAGPALTGGAQVGDGVAEPAVAGGARLNGAVPGSPGGARVDGAEPVSTGGARRGVVQVQEQDVGVLGVVDGVASVRLKESRGGGSDAGAGEVVQGAGRVSVGSGADSGGEGSTGGHGFMQTYVRIQAVRDLVAKLESVCGHKVPRSGHGDLALARYTAGTVPTAFVNGKARLRALAVVGDSALLTVRMAGVYRAGGDLEVMEEDRELLTDNVLARAFASSDLALYVLVVSGVNLGNTKTGATAFEAFAGVLAMHCGLDAVAKYFKYFGVDAFYGRV